MSLLVVVVAAVMGVQQTPPATKATLFGTLGVAAYEREDYAAALALLKRDVYDSGIGDDPLGPLDPWSAVYLARMFYRGEGTKQDGTLACALFNVAVRENEGRFGDLNSAAQFRTIVGMDPCAALAPSADSEVRALMNGCFLPGITSVEFPLEAGWVVVDRTGIHVQVGDTHQDEGLPSIGLCHYATLPIAHSQVSVERGSALVTRDFLHFFTWKSGKRDSHIVRELQWYLLEVAASGVRVAHMLRLGEAVDGPHPSVEVSLDPVYSVVLQAAPGGKVEWVLPELKRRGIIY